MHFCEVPSILRLNEADIKAVAYLSKLGIPVGRRLWLVVIGHVESSAYSTRVHRRPRIMAHFSRAYAAFLNSSGEVAIITSRTASL